jgi:1-acyl-sn-glycerol-3-phosphate acyltransferase
MTEERISDLPKDFASENRNSQLKHSLFVEGSQERKRNLFELIFHYPGPLWWFASILGFVCVVISVPLWATVILNAVLFGASRKIQTSMVRSWLRFVCFSFQIRFQVSGTENFQSDEPSLVVSNHQSLFDIPAAFFALKGHLRMVAKKELFSIPFFGWCLSKTEFIPVDRGNRKSGQEASENIKTRIKSGLHIWVAPEGTRSVDGQLAPFKKGSFSVAISAQIPIQPILVLDSRLSCPKGSLLVRPGTFIRVMVLPRVNTSGYTIEKRGQLAEDVRAMMSQKMSNLI